TQKLEPGMPIPVIITAYADRSFTFVTKTPPNSYFLMKAAGIEKGSQTPGKGTVGKVSMKQIREIAEKLVKERAKAKFDETIEVSVNLNVDPRKSEQNVRGTVQLPNGTGKTLRV